MPASFACLRYHLVFSTKGRQPRLQAEVRPRLFEFIGGILRHRRGELLAAGGTDNHVHLLATLPRDRSLADILRDVKSNSSAWLNELGVCGPDFRWQDGYGAFTVGRDEIERLERYLAGQEEHHRTRPFEEEFVQYLDEAGIAYDPRYIWA